MIKLDVVALHKTPTSQNYRQIINIKSIEVCKLMENIENFPMFSGYVNWFNLTFPGMVRKCPYKDFMVINSSFYNNDLKNVHRTPNGLMRRNYYSLSFNPEKIADQYNNNCSYFVNIIVVSLHFYDHMDSNIISISILTEVKVVGKGNDEFMFEF